MKTLFSIPGYVYTALLKQNCFSSVFGGFDAGGCENLSHWGIHPDSAFVRWDNAVISPHFQRENNTLMIS